MRSRRLKYFGIEALTQTKAEDIFGQAPAAKAPCDRCLLAKEPGGGICC